MIAALALASYAVGLAWWAPRWLGGRSWAERSPRAALRAWQAVLVSVGVAASLAALAVAAPVLPGVAALAGALGVEPDLLAAHYASPGGRTAGVAVLVALGSLVAAWVALVAVSLVRVRRATALRRRQRVWLDAAGHPHADGFTVVDSATPVVYCLPGRPAQVVASTGALGLLSATQRRLVLGHEQRHLRSGHHRLLACSATLAAALRPLPLFATAHRRMSALAEMEADEVAVAPGERRDLARALLDLGAPVPGGALGASGTATAERVRRLVEPPRRRTSLGAGAVVVVLLAAAPVLAVAPAVEAAVHHCALDAR